MGRINQRIVRAGIGLLLALAVLGVWLGQSRAQTPAQPSLRLLPAQAPADAPAFVPGVVLVRLRGGETRTADAAQRLGVESAALTPLRISGQAALYRLAVATGAEMASAARLAARPDVLYAEPDFLFFVTETTPNDTLYEQFQWNLRHIRAETAWDRTTGSSSVIIAIVDTGVDLGHPDLAAKIVPGIDEINNDSDPQDDQGHGTHVASIASALTNNDVGIAGVDWNARIMPVKVLDANGSGSSAAVAAGIAWAADNGADIINLSLSGTNPATVIENAVQYAYAKGVLLIAAAGNAYNNGNPTSYPAAYPNVLGVAAVNDSDGHASYSNSGGYVDVAAPGGDPSSPFDNDSRHWIAGAYWRGAGVSYALLAGTSQAAPHVAGLAGLLLALDGSLTPDQLAQIITSSALDVQSPGWDEFSGYGRIDVAAALAAVLPPATATPTDTPTVTPTASPTPTQTPTPTLTPTHTPSPPPRSREDVRVNDNPTNRQAFPALAIDSANDLTALWRDRRSGTEALYSAALASAGIAWGENLLLTGTQQISATGQIGLPGLGVREGEALAVWHAGQANRNENNAFVSRLEQATGRWNEPEPLPGDTTPTNSRSNPAIALAGDGTEIAVWEESTSFTRAGPFSRLFWSQSSGSSGTWSEKLPLASSSDSQRSARLAVAGSVVYAIWVESGGETGNRILTTQRSLTSVFWSPPTILTASSAKSLSQPDFAADGDGNLLALWQESSAVESGPVVYAAWKLAGSGWSTGQQVGGERSVAGQFSPRVANNSQEVALVWWDTRADTGDIYIRWAAWPGGEWSPEQRVNQDKGTSEQSNPDVAIDQWGNTTVVWGDARNPSSAPDIYSRFIPAGERFRVYLPEVAKP